MITLRPGSFAWLLAHDVRQGLREFTDMFARFSPAAGAACGLVGLLVLHLLAWPAAQWLKPVLEAPGSDTQMIAALGCILAWIIAQGLLGATRLLFTRGDLDLLLTSPLPGERVFAARMTSLAAGSFVSVAVLTVPVANAGALLYGPVWLSAYVVLASLAFAGTAVGLALGMALFFAVGPRHARLIAQLGAAAIAGAFVLGVQVAALMPKELRAEIAASFGMLGGETGAVFSVAIAAVRGELSALGLMLGVALALFAVAVTLLGRAFIRASLSAAGATSDGSGLRSMAGPVRFTSGLGASLRRKEWRLMLRDPNLFAQLSLQIIYTVPVAVVLLTSDAGIPVVLAVAPTLVVIATQIAASLAWITVSGEDAPELIAAAPVSRAEVDVGKLAAIALPVLAIIAVPLAGLAWISPYAALLTLICVAGGSVSTALLNLWHPMPGKRRGMLRRHSQSKVMGLVEHGLAMLWAVVMVMALIGTVFVVLPLLVIAGVMAPWSPMWKRVKPMPLVLEPAVA